MGVLHRMTGQQQGQGVGRLVVRRKTALWGHCMSVIGNGNRGWGQVMSMRGGAGKGGVAEGDFLGREG